MAKDIIIIGAGVAGLSTGCYGQMNGYRTEIFEMHDKPGGLCTAWQRRDYTIDGCIHWLVGTRPDSAFRRLWDELGALEGTEIINHEEFTRAEAPDGKALILYADADRLEQHLKELAPEDAGLIEEFTTAIRAFSLIEPQLDPLPVDFDMSTTDARHSGSPGRYGQVQPDVRPAVDIPVQERRSPPPVRGDVDHA